MAAPSPRNTRFNVKTSVFLRTDVGADQNAAANQLKAQINQTAFSAIL